MNNFNALLIGKDFPPAGLAVSARFELGQLVLNGRAVVVEATDLVVSVGGVEQPALFLNWLDDNGAQAALTPRTADDLAILLASAPPSLHTPLQQWRLRARNRHQVWGWLGAGGAACALILLVLWWQAPNAVAWLAGKIPVTVEEKLGSAVLAQLRGEGALQESGPQQQAVQRIGARLTENSAYRYRWIVKQDPTVNAFAMPGGIVVVHSALLAKVANPTELAAVLAHEIQHIEQRHSLRQMITSLGWGALLALTLGDVSSVAALVAHQAGTLYFSRDMEEEADRLGFQALLRARIKPDGMLGFFQTLEKQQGETATALPAWVSSHPPTASRIARIRTMIVEQPCPECRVVEGDLGIAK